MHIIRIYKKIAFTILVLLMLSHTFITFGYDEDNHNAFMNRILYGSELPNYNNKDANKYIKAIEYASYLCVDQYNGNHPDYLQYLNNTIKVKGIIKSLSKINFTSNYSHRRFTHQGWNHKYTHTLIPNNNIYEDDNWKYRKGILLGTINKIFGFGMLSNGITGYDKKCEALSSLIYYIHLIGDYHAMNEEDYNEYRLNANKHPYMMVLYKSEDPTNIINDIKANIETLFSNQKNQTEYRNLLSPSISRLDDAKNKISYENNYNEFHSACEELLNVLSENVPELLKKEEFFKKIFF